MVASPSPKYFMGMHIKSDWGTRTLPGIVKPKPVGEILLGGHS